MERMAGQIAELDSRLNQTNAKADQALENLQRSQAKKEIDRFFSDVSGDAGGTSGLLFVVTGHTDNAGSEKYNYDLARIRAENTASYLADRLAKGF